MSLFNNKKKIFYYLSLTKIGTTGRFWGASCGADVHMGKSPQFKKHDTMLTYQIHL